MTNMSIGVENTNKNVYDVVISASEFMNKVDWELLKQQGESYYDECRDLLERAEMSDFLLEHVDTHLDYNDDKVWRVQLRLSVPVSQIAEKWNEVAMFMRYTDSMWDKYFLTRTQFDTWGTAFYGVITFYVPATDMGNYLLAE